MSKWKYTNNDGKHIINNERGVLIAIVCDEDIAIDIVHRHRENERLYDENQSLRRSLTSEAVKDAKYNAEIMRLRKELEEKEKHIKDIKTEKAILEGELSQANAYKHFEAERTKEAVQLHKELEEAQREARQWRSKYESKHELLVMTDTSRNEKDRMYREALEAANRYQQELEKEQRSKDVMANYLNELMHNTSNTVIASQIWNVLREAIGRDEFDPVGQEGEGNQ